jgi:hypothetical protein
MIALVPQPSTPSFLLRQFKNALGVHGSILQAASIFLALILSGSGAKAEGPVRNTSLTEVSAWNESMNSRVLVPNHSSAFLLPNPNIIVRFANPQFNCATDEYCVDVEFQSDTADQEIFGMNVRFFYEEYNLEFVNFRDFQGGYGPVAPNPPQKLTSPPAFGYNFFRFGSPGDGPAEWINGAIQLIDENQPPIFISTTGWTKLFQVCFVIDQPDPDSISFCPPLVWDLEQNPALGGYLGGDDGVVILVVDQQTGFSVPSMEHVEQFNWAYTGDGLTLPYGQPTPTNCIDLSCGLNIVCPADIIIDCEASTLPGTTGTATSDDSCPGTPVITYVDSISTGTCGAGNQIFRVWTATDSCGNVSSCQQIITIDERGSICGTVSNDLGQPMPGVEIRLWVDVNSNGFRDTGDTLSAVTFSNTVTGGYCFSLIDPCDYILEEIQPLHHGDLADYDLSPDPDGNDSLDGPDNEIPVSLTPCEADSNNHFVNIVCPVLFPVLPPDTICENGNVLLAIDDLNIGTVTYTWNFGSGSSPGVGVGLGPHTVSYAATMENQVSGAVVSLTIAKSGCPDTTAAIGQIMINTYPDASINGSTAQGCFFANRIYQPASPEIPGATYQWNFGSDAVPAMAVGYGPHTVYYTTAGSKTITLLVEPNAPGAQCADSSAITFNIVTCMGNIVGTVKTTDNVPIPGVNVRLFADMDINGVADNNDALRSVYTTSTGVYAMSSIDPGHYVIVQIQPLGWDSFNDRDTSEDGDVVANIDSLDNKIPVSLYGGELDSGNAFTEVVTPGNITGAVFNDLNGNQTPDPGEGFEHVVISLFADANTDGIADTIVPLSQSTTNSEGSYAFAGVGVGHYVLVETNPSGMLNIRDFDATHDGDAVANANMLNDTLPVTLTNGEIDAHNYFVDADSCSLMVTNTHDSGPGSFRAAIECASANDTIFFHSSLAASTILINSARILLDKNIVIYSTLAPRIKLESQITGFFDIVMGHEVEFRQVDIVSGLFGNTGAAFKNEGILKLHDVSILRNPSLPVGEYLIYNDPVSQLFFKGSCYFQTE